MPLEVQTLTYAADVSFQESVDNGLRAIELSTGGENSYSEVGSRYRTSVSLLRLGKLDAVRPHTMAMVDIVARRSVSRVFAGLCFEPILSLSCLEGDWNSGRKSSNQGLEFLPLIHVRLLDLAPS